MEGPLSGQPLEDSHHGENQPDHGIAFRKDHVEALFPLMDGRAGHYVFVSSFVVYGTGVRNRAFQMVPEDEADLSLATGCDYAVGKRQCESVLKCDPVLKRETVLKCDSVLHRESANPGVSSVPWTIVRFCNIEGQGDPSNRRGFFIDRIADGGGLLVPSDVAQPFQPLWRDDAARAIALVAGNPAAFGLTLPATRF